MTEDLQRTLAPDALLSASSSYLNYLPVIFQNDDFLAKFLRIFETVWEPLEQRQDRIEMYFDPHTCPKSFLPWLAGWLDLTFNENWPEEQMRKMIREGFPISRWRGTQHGLGWILELCTGSRPVIEPSATDPFVFRIEITLSNHAAATESFITQVIQLHKPAHIGYILEVMRCPE